MSWIILHCAKARIAILRLLAISLIAYIALYFAARQYSFIKLSGPLPDFSTEYTEYLLQLDRTDRIMLYYSYYPMLWLDHFCFGSRFQIQKVSFRYYDRALPEETLEIPTSIP